MGYSVHCANRQMIGDLMKVTNVILKTVSIKTQIQKSQIAVVEEPDFVKNSRENVSRFDMYKWTICLIATSSS